MTNAKQDSLWVNIRAVSESQRGRQAMLTTGTLIAGAYLGYVGPELFSTMHDALAFYATKYPFLDPLAMSSALWDGAKHFSASAIDYVAQVAENVGIEVTANMREAAQTAREFLSRGSERGLEAARVAFEETAHYVSGSAKEIVESIGGAGSAAVGFVKEHWGKIMAFGAVAKEAYEFFDTGDNIYKRWLKRGKKDVETCCQKETPRPTEINITVNTAIAGSEALTSADNQARREAVAERYKVDLSDVLWVSEQMHDRLSSDGSLAAQAAPSASKSKFGSTKIDLDALLKSPELHVDKERLSNIDLVVRDNANKLRTRWADSPDSLRRLDALRGGRRKTSSTEFDISDPLAFKKGDADGSAGLVQSGLKAANDNKYETSTDDCGPELM
jgi:hypothetical protein